MSSGKNAMLMRMMRLIEEQMAYINENSSFSKEEKLDQQIVLMKMGKYIKHFDELEPVINDYFVKKAKKEKWER